MPIDVDAKFTQTPGCDINQMPDGFVVYQAEREKVHYLNPQAAIVYELCGESQSVGAIIRFLQASFSLTEPPVSEVEACIETLLTEDLIKPCPPSSSAP